MTLPIYKKILIKASSARIINSQLDQIDFGENPFIFHFPATLENQLDCIKHIENYFDEHEINTFSYPIYIVSDEENYQGPLKIIREAANAPRFFRHKSKQLSIKENQKFEVVKLKQQRLNGLRSSEFKSQLEEYGKNSKLISQLYTEQQFLNNILNKLEKDEHGK